MSVVLGSVVEDEGGEVAGGERERWGGGVAGWRAGLQKGAGAGGVQTGLGALHPAGDLLKQIPGVLLISLLFLLLLLLLGLPQVLHAVIDKRGRLAREAAGVMLPVGQVQDQFRLRVVLRLALPPGYPVQVGWRAHFVIA